MDREEDEKVFQLLERDASSLPCTTVAPQKNCVQQEDDNVSRQLLSREAFSLPCTSLAPALLGRTLCRRLPSQSILRAEVTKTKTTKNLSENFTLQTSLSVHHLYHCWPNKDEDNQQLIFHSPRLWKRRHTLPAARGFREPPMDLGLPSSIPSMGWPILPSDIYNSHKNHHHHQGQQVFEHLQWRNWSMCSASSSSAITRAWGDCYHQCHYSQYFSSLLSSSTILSSARSIVFEGHAWASQEARVERMGGL